MMKKIFYFIVVGIGLLTACSKGDLVENTKYEKIDYGNPKYAYLKILNVTPGSPTVNFYLDGTKFSTNLSNSGVENSGYTYNGIFPDLGYATTSPGNHVLTAKIIVTESPNASLEVFNQAISPAAGKYYTVFTSGIYNTITKKIPSSVMVEDIRPSLDTSKIYIRVANFYNGSTNLDLIKDSATGTKIVSNVAYGTVSTWAEIPALVGGATNSVKIFLNTTTTIIPLISAGTTLTFTKGRAYTLYTRGVLGDAAYPLTATFSTTFY